MSEKAVKFKVSSGHVNVSVDLYQLVIALMIQQKLEGGVL